MSVATHATTHLPFSIAAARMAARDEEADQATDGNANVTRGNPRGAIVDWTRWGVTQVPRRT